MAAWQKRVIKEKAELVKKVKALIDLHRSDEFKLLDGIDQQLLSAQLSTMQAYTNILNLRISRF